MREHTKRKPRDVVAGLPIVGFTGANGAGKTLLAVDSAIADMAAGRAVHSTVQIDSPFGSSIPIRTLRELTDLRDATLLFDDIAVIFSSRTSGALPPEMDVLFQVMRHQNLTVRWTAPAWGRADIRLREVTQAVVNVAQLVGFRHGGEVWPRPLLVMAGVADALGVAVDAKPTKVLRRRIYRPRSLASWGAYDTLASTPQIGVRAPSGVCIDCGGSIVRPKHDAARHDLLGLPFWDSELVGAKSVHFVGAEVLDESVKESVSSPGQPCDVSEVNGG